MKHLIKIESAAHGVLGVRHEGKDQQYCESGEQVILSWQPDAKWGLQEAHYTDGDGNITPIDLTRVKVNGKDVVVFTMPDDNITVGGTFKRFVIDDWAGFSEVLETLEAKIEELESSKFVELFINSTNTTANFVWPFEDTELGNVEIIGYIGSAFSDENKISRVNIRFAGTAGYATLLEYGGYKYWSGELQKLEKGKFYSFKGADLGTTNAHVYLRPIQQ